MNKNRRQRQEMILAQLYEKQEVRAAALAKDLEISEATSRRDLRTLAQAGQVVLSYGGAVLARSTGFSFSSKAIRNVEAKRIIGALAASLANNGDQVFIDSGTTAYAMAPHLKSKRGLSVVANSARLVLELDSPNLEVILLGGQYRHERMDTIGPLAQAALDQLHGYVAFLGTDGLSMDHGVTASDVESAFLFRRAAANARKVILLADHSKFAAPSLCRLVGWDAIHLVVTDLLPAPPWLQFFAERSIPLLCPELSQASPGAASAKPVRPKGERPTRSRKES